MPDAPRRPLLEHGRLPLPLDMPLSKDMHELDTTCQRLEQELRACQSQLAVCRQHLHMTLRAAGPGRGRTSSTVDAALALADSWLERGHALHEQVTVVQAQMTNRRDALERARQERVRRAGVTA